MTNTKLVTGDGTGDYDCDGSDDQEIINKALYWAAMNPGNRVHLTGPFQYQVTDQVLIGSDTILSGDATACLKVPDMACGNTPQTCVFPDGRTVLAAIPGVIPKRVEIYGFEFDGNCQHQALKLGLAHGKPASAGSGVERLIGLRGDPYGEKASDIKIHDMYFHDAFGEAAQIAFAENVEIYNNEAENHQHDAFFFIEVKGKNVLRNCNIKGITDGCARWDNCSNWQIFRNKFLAYTGTNNNTAYLLGQNGIQIANEATNQAKSLTRNMEVFDNEFIGPHLCGIWLNDTLQKAGTTPQEVWVHNNYFTECGWRDTSVWSGGISIGPWGSGVKIDHNILENCYNNSIQFYNIIATGCTAEVNFNNILNTKGSRTFSATGPKVVGYGILNAIPGKIKVTAEGNYIFGSKSGKCYNVVNESEALESLPDAGIVVEEPVNTGSVKIILICQESEIDGFCKELTQKYTVFDKV